MTHKFALSKLVHGSVYSFFAKFRSRIIVSQLVKTHTKSEIDIKNRVPLEDPLDGEVVFDEGTYYASSEWEMVSASARINEMKYECCPDLYQDVTLTFVQKRYSYQPSLILGVPCILTAILIMLSFLLEPGSGEKVGLSKFQ